MKAFADKKLKCDSKPEFCFGKARKHFVAQIMIATFDMVENIVVKEENTCYLMTKLWTCPKGKYFCRQIRCVCETSCPHKRAIFR